MCQLCHCGIHGSIVICCCATQVSVWLLARAGSVSGGYSSAPRSGALDAASQVTFPAQPNASSLGDSPLVCLHVNCLRKQQHDAFFMQCRHADHEALQPASQFAPREYPGPDGQVTFALNDSLYRSGTNHDHDQPAHLQLRNAGIPEIVNRPIYAGLESRYCPAGAT